MVCFEYFVKYTLHSQVKAKHDRCYCMPLFTFIYCVGYAYLPMKKDNHNKYI